MGTCRRLLLSRAALVGGGDIATNPAEQIFRWIGHDRKERAYAVLANGSVVSNHVVSNDPRESLDWLRDYRVKRILGPYGCTGVWCHDGSVIANKFPDRKRQTIFSPAPELRITAAHACDSSNASYLFHNGTLGFFGPDPARPRYLAIVQVPNEFPDGVGTGKFRVDSIVGTGWVTLADGRLVGSMGNPPLPPTPIGSTVNRVVSVAKTASHQCIAAREDGSIGECFRSCRPAVPYQCKGFGRKYALPSSY